jgi:transmembrane sensor
MNKRPNFEARRHARRITEQAAAWYLEQQDQPTERQQAAFLAWLRASPAHVAEYLAIAQMHGDLKAAASVETLSMMELVNKVKNESPIVAFPHMGHTSGRDTEAQPGERRKGGVLLRIAAAAAMVALVVLGGLHWRESGANLNQRYTAGSNAIKVVRLPDGSEIHLAANATIDVHFDRQVRRIAVVEGNALFDVGKDPQRPMLVTVGGHVLQDIGTVFDVQHSAGGDTLTVISGHVRVWNVPPAWTGKVQDLVGSSPIAGNAVADLTAGQQIQLDASHASSVQPAVIAQTTAWLPTEIRFQHETVGDVARRFNAYTTTPLEIDDAHIASLRISGVFHANNPDAFVAYLSTLPGVKVERGDDHVRILAITNAGNKSVSKL